MARRILFGVFLVLLAVAFYAYAGEVKLTTYYPAPYGEYKKVVATTLGVGDNDATPGINSGDAPNPATNPGEVWIKGNVGIGTTTPGYPIDIYKLYNSAVGGYAAAINTYTRYNASGAGANMGIRVINDAGHSSGVMPNLSGVSVLSRNLYGGTVSYLRGLTVRVDNTLATGTVNEGIGVLIQNNIGAGTITDNYGIYQEGTTAKNYFAGKVGIGITAPTARLYVADSDNTCAVFQQSSDITNGVAILGYQSGGTLAAPTATLNNRALLDLGGCGYTSTTNFVGSRVRISMRSTENWTATAQGAKMTFFTTANGGVATAERMCINHDGNIGIGTTAPAQRLEVAGITRLGVAGDATRAAEIYMSASNGNFGGNKFILRFPSTIATSANDEMWIGIGGGSGSLRGGYVGHIQMVAENLHFNTSYDSAPAGSRDGLTTFTGGVMIMANESALMVPRNSGTPTKPLRSGSLNGCIYYNTNTNELRVYKNGAWRNIKTS